MNFFAALEQMHAMLLDIAPIMCDYFKALNKHGMTRKEALQMTIAYQKLVFPTEENR